MKARLKLNSYICRALGVNGITLYPFVFIREGAPSARLLAHEAIHVDQVRRAGFFRFYASYLLQYLRSRAAGLTHHDAYLNISFEKEAYAHENSWESYRSIYGASRSMPQDPSEFFV